MPTVTYPLESKVPSGEIPSVKQPTGSVSFSLAVQNGTPIRLDTNVQNGYYAVRDLNGTALVTGKIVATAPINFYITEKGNAGPIAFEALNVTTVNIRVPLPKGQWVFGFLSSGVESNVTVVQITLNYSYFGCNKRVLSIEDLKEPINARIK